MTTYRRITRLLPGVGALILLLTAFALPTFAQTNKGTITGTVTDQNGGTVAGATVVVTNVDTNTERSVTTSDDGNYEVPLLDPGNYRVAVSAPNFSKTIQENVKLETAARQPVDVVLQPGAVGAEVTITAAPQLVESESSDRGSVVTGREVTELPLSGRNFTQLATLTPGVTRAANVGQGGGPEARAFNNGDPRAGSGGPGASNENGSTETSRFSRSGGAALSVNGQRPTNNNFSLDGVDNNEPQFGTIGIFPNPDSIAEFKVTTSVPPAEVGRAAGAVVNTTTKSGTNDFHGSLYYYGQNSALNAYHPALKTRLAETVSRTNPSPLEVNALQKAVQQIHEFGGTIGGPILRNRTFFFFDYLGQRNNLPFPANTTVPTLLTRGGNFTEFSNQDCNFDGDNTDAVDGPVCDPTRPQAFAGGIIPGARITSVGQNYLSAFPSPTRNVFDPGDALSNRNFFTQRGNQEVINNFGIKIDHRLTDNNSLTGRFNEQKLNTVRANLLPDIPTAGFGAGEERGNSRQLVITDTHTFSPTILNEFRFGLTQIQISIFNCGVGGACGVSPTFSSDIGIPNSNDGSLEASGGALIGGFGTGFHEFTGDGGLFQVKSKNPYFADSLTVIKGNQIWKFGGEMRLRYLNTIDAGRTGTLKGQFQYPNDRRTGTNAACPAASIVEFRDEDGDLTGTGCLVDANGIPFGGSGNAQADILLGVPARFVSKAKIFGGPFDLRSQEIGFFVQDDWKVNDNLTLNLGLRYDLLLPFSEANGRYSLYDIEQRQVIVATGSGDRIVETDKNNFGPRAGFAYAFGAEKKLVVRGGVGLLYTVDGVDYPPGVRNPPYSNSVAFDQNSAGRTTTFSLSTGAPDPGQVDPLNLTRDIGVFAVDPEQKTPYTTQFQLSFQYQFARDWSLDVGYVGNRSRNLLLALDISSGGSAEALNTAGQFLNNAVIYTNRAFSNYDGMQAQVRKRLSRNIQGQVSYTWSHTIDNSTGIFNGLGEQRGGRGGPINPLDINSDRGNSSLDVRHLLSADAIIDMPFGRGQRYLSQGGALSKLYSGIQMNFIVYARSGYPYSVRCDNCSGANRPSLIGDPFANLPAGRLLNPAAFSTNVATLNSVTNAAGNTIRFGNLGRNTFRGPSLWTTDMSIFKNTGITENVNFQLGIEFFNLFNRANYTVPENNVNNGDFGSIRFNAQSGRVVQYRAKFIF
jgi:hypothetical protein